MQSHLKSWMPYIAACAAAVIGATVFMSIGFPVAPLTGSALGVSLACMLGAKAYMPHLIRNSLLLVLGINIGSAVSPAALSAAATWPLSIAILTLSMAMSMIIGSLGLVRWFSYDRKSAFLATCPGHLSFVIGMAGDDGLDVSAIAVAQSIRVLAITIFVPLILGQAAPAVAEQSESLSHLILGLMIILSIGVGFGFKALYFPAPFLLAGMAISGISHGAGWVEGRLNPTLLTICLIGMGLLIGSRFSGVGWHSLRKALVAGLWVTCVNGITTGGAVILSAFLLGLGAPLLIAAYSPGGIEAMAAISMVLGLSPTFVAAHHVARLAILSVTIPLAYKFIFSRSS